MRLFQPSPAFQAFYDRVIADAERPVTAGTYVLAIPTFASTDERVFAETVLGPLIAQIDQMKRSVTPTATPVYDSIYDPYYYSSAP